MRLRHVSIHIHTYIYIYICMHSMCACFRLLAPRDTQTEVPQACAGPGIKWAGYTPICTQIRKSSHTHTHSSMPVHWKLTGLEATEWVYLFVESIDGKAIPTQGRKRNEWVYVFCLSTKHIHPLRGGRRRSRRPPEWVYLFCHYLRQRRHTHSFRFLPWVGISFPLILRQKDIRIQRLQDESISNS